MIRYIARGIEPGCLCRGLSGKLEDVATLVEVRETIEESTVRNVPDGNENTFHLKGALLPGFPVADAH